MSTSAALPDAAPPARRPDRRRISRRARPLRPLRWSLRSGNADSRRSSVSSAGCASTCMSRGFQAQLTAQLTSWVGRPTALTFAARLSARWGAQLWLKREDLAHTGAHKINNAIGQALLAQRLGARRIVAETGAGQHGVASAAACARLGLPCTVYMGVDRHGAPGAQRGTHAPAGCRGRARDHGRSHAARRHRRGTARLGVGSARNLLSARLGRGPASVPLPGARAAVRDRPRSARADARRNGCSAGCGHRLCRRRLQFHGRLSCVHPRHHGRDHRRRGGRARRGPG